jgi:biopolymer transport protein ExbD
MLWFPLHRKQSIFDYRSPFQLSLRSYRRFEPKFVVDFIWFIMSFWLLAFIVKIGILLFFTQTGMMEIDLAYSLQKVDLPSATSAERIENRRLIYYVTVEREGKYRIGKYYTDPEDLQKHFQRIRWSLPNVIVGIIADKECRMEDINNLLTILRKSHILRISFYCKQIVQLSDYRYL